MTPPDSMPEFVPALAITGDFFTAVVQPILAARFPALQYGAALIGPGSEVLGLDTPMSMDHDWGLRLFLFLGADEEEEDDEERASSALARRIVSVLSHELPPTFRGFPVAMATPTTTSSVRAMDTALQDAMDGPVRHHIVPLTVRRFCKLHLAGCDPTSNPGLSAAEWLSIPGHALGEVVAGAVYFDGTGEITRLRQALAWYPRDVHLYMLAAAWQRIGDEEHLMPRAGEAGSDLGAALIAARLARDVMHLCFLMERRYAPYAKWLGAAFRRLDCAPVMEPLLRRALAAAGDDDGGWEARQAALGEAYEALARMHNRLGLTPRRVMHVEVSQFHGRPWKVIHGEQFAAALVEEGIEDEEVRRIAARSLIGGVSQWSDNVAVEHVRNENVQAMYR